mgnify:CR=1 FL=1
MTYYDSYAKCCPNNPNYDPHYSKDECKDDDACKYSGEFYCSDKKLPFDYVKNNNIVSFFD